MSIDLTGGLAPSVDFPLTRAPEDPAFREGMNFWIQEDQGRFTLPRVAIEVIGKAWDVRAEHVAVAFPDGRALIHRGEGDKTTPEGPGGATLVFRCLEPFRRWSLDFRGTAMSTTDPADLVGPLVHGCVVEFHIEATMAAPPWIQGALGDEAKRMLAEDIEGLYMGGFRYEQLCRCEGTFALDGEQMHFTGTGLRIRRHGRRALPEWRGHCWQSAVFPSGRGFGYIAFPPRADGTTTYNEGYLLRDGRLIPARAVQAPWLDRGQPSGGGASVVFESELGRTRIEGEMVAFRPGAIYESDPTGQPVLEKRSPLQQGMARYRWDGEEAYGMIERSFPAQSPPA